MVKKIFVSMLIIMILINCGGVGSFAASGSLDFATREFPGTRPAPPPPATPADDSGTPPTPSTPTPTTEVEKSINIVVPTKLQGTVYEDYIRETTVADSSVSGGTKHVTNDGKYNPGEPTVEGVTVSISGTELKTDNTGTYSFEGSGKYDVSFTYGKNTLDSSKYNFNKETLKYNGQDYYMNVNGSETAGTELSWVRKIKEMKKSYTEVFIVIDYSVSMRDDSDGTARLDIVKVAAKNFVNQLFSESEGNLAVGFIAFGYEAVIIKAPTDIREEVINGIDKFSVYDSGSNAGIMYYDGIPVYGTYSALNHKPGTNIGGAVRKAKNSFTSPDSTQIVVLFSDGCATAHDSMTDTLYADDSDETIKNALNNIASKTRDDIQSVVNSGVTLISILNKTEGLEKEYVEKAFKNAGGSWIGSYYEVNYDDRAAVEEALLKDTKRIIESKETGLTTFDASKDFSGSDDVARRRFVNEYYSKFYYGNLGLFAVIDKLTGTQTADIETVAKWLEYEKYDRLSAAEKKDLYKQFINSTEVKEFMNNSWVNTQSSEVTLYQVSRDASGRPTSISCGGTAAYTFEYYENEGVSYCKVNGEEYKAANVSVSETITELNAGLVKRDEFKLEVEEKITGYKLTLSDGTVLYNSVSEDAKKTLSNAETLKKWYSQQLMINNGMEDKLKESDLVKQLKKVKIKEVDNFPEMVYLTIDTSVIQGATLEVEYTIIVKNNSKNGTFCREFSLVNYFDNGLVYRPDNPLMTEPGTNEDYGWKQITKKDLNNAKYISKDVDKYGDNVCLFVNYNESAYRNAEGIENNGMLKGVSNYDSITDKTYETKTKYINPVIGNNQERYVKVVLSRVLTPEIIQDFTYKNQTEIMEYANNNNRRTNWVETVAGSAIGKYKYPISGNYIPTGFLENLEADFTHINEIDTAVTNSVKVVPPTGRPSLFKTLFKTFIK